MARVKAVKVDEQNKVLTLEIGLEEPGTLSSSGKMVLLACSRGNQQTDATYTEPVVNGKGGASHELYANVTVGYFATPKKG